MRNMKKSKTKRIGLLILIVLIILSLSFCLWFRGRVVYEMLADEVIEGLTLDEAQELVLFPVCLPTHIPASVEISNSIRYHAEFGDPYESDLTINLVDKHTGEIRANQKILFREGWRGDPFESEDINHVFLLRELLGWKVGWSQVDEFEEKVTESYDVIQTSEDEVFRVVEISYPEIARSMVVYWKQDPLLYFFFSSLPYDETMEIVSSIPDCYENQPSDSGQ